MSDHKYEQQLENSSLRQTESPSSPTEDSVDRPGRSSKQHVGDGIATAESITVTVTVDSEESTIRYDVTISIDDNLKWAPVATYAERHHQLKESSQFDFDAVVDFINLPEQVKEQVALAIPGVDDWSELSIVHPQ